ncbi:Glyoxalase/Bleomycin resistance protein/Dihydroxybiphenyl dioxygenase [Hypoxylon sp. FL1284]|nr:Glyoxalase/Bleomycin resistance protein/Dihydroxybiphenyl dioxygenase [Hypoxylon sp. FL1284]
MVDANVSGKVLSPAKMAHVVLRTTRFKPMVAFYTTFLGAHISLEVPQLAFLTYDEEHHRIAIGGFGDSVDKVPKSAGLEHIAFTYNTLSELMTSYRQRKARGIMPFWCINHGPTTSMYYQDPDGNQLEVQVDNFDTAEEASRFMTDPQMTINPFGVDFDPEELIKRLESGESEAELKKIPKSGPRGYADIPLHNMPPPPVAKDSYDLIEGAA